MCVVLELYKFIYIVIIAIPSYILLVTHVNENTTDIFNCVYICIPIIHNTGIVRWKHCYIANSIFDIAHAMYVYTLDFPNSLPSLSLIAIPALSSLKCILS